MATQAHPELKSRPTRPHPLFAGFVGAALEYNAADRLPVDVDAGPAGRRRAQRRVSTRAAVNGDRPVSAHQYEVVESKERFVGGIFSVALDQVTMPGGGTAWRDYTHHLGAVAVVALDDEGRVVLVRQYRHPVRAVSGSCRPA